MSADFIPNTKEVEKMKPFKGWVYERFPFIQEDFDSLTSYELWCKVVDYINKVGKSLNDIADNNEELVTAFTNLQNYVNNYFDNLDVQEEINNKLDDMVTSGTMDEIINQEIFGQINQDITNLGNSIDTINNTTIPAINEEIDNIESDINTINNDTIPDVIYNLTEQLGQKYTDIPPRYYIDIINGDDNNDGTSEHPFQSLDRFFELLNTGTHDLRCYIVSAGTYQVSKSQFLDCTIHMTANTSGVVVEFTTDNYCSFYNTHISINSISDSQPLTIRYSKGLEGLTIENTASNIQNVVFDNIILNYYGGYTRMVNTTFSRIYFNGTNASLQHTTITGLSNGTGLVVRYSSQLSIYGTFDITGSNHTSNIFSIERSIANILISTTSTGNNRTTGYSVNLDGSMLITNTNSLNILNGIASGGYAHSSSSILNTAYKELQ